MRCMDFELCPKAREYRERLQEFMDGFVYPAEHVRTVARQELRRYER